MTGQLISIIIPVYNLELYIGKTVESVLNQTYENIEIIIVNDGSADNSIAVINALAEANPDKIRVVDKENGGVTSARLAGISVSSGDYIGFVDGDDEIDSVMYERLLGNALKYNADISHCGYRIVYGDGSEKDVYGTKRIIEQDCLSALRELLSGEFIEPALCNKLYKKELFSGLLAGGLMDLGIKNNEDLLMNYYLFKNSRSAVYEDVCLYRYQKREGSASRRPLCDNLIYDPIRVKRIIMNDANGELKPFAEQRYVRCCIDSYNKLQMYKKSAWKNDAAEIRGYIKERRLALKRMSARDRISGKLILHFPCLYRVIYRICR